jgi:hypothetical protein
MKLKDIREMNDLRDLSSGDMADLLDELRAIATKRGTELLAQGRAGARKAMGAPDPGAVGAALVVGMMLGALVGACVALFMTPMAGREARQKLVKQVDQVRERIPEMRTGHNGRARYEPYEPMTVPTTPGGAMSGGTPAV